MIIEMLFRGGGQDGGEVLEGGVSTRFLLLGTGLLGLD